MAPRVLGPGTPDPLGIRLEPTADVANVALFSSSATTVEFCVWVGTDVVRLPLHEGIGGIWHARVAGVRPGTHYAFAVTGPDDPTGQRLLVDPYARAITGSATQPRAIVMASAGIPATGSTNSTRAEKRAPGPLVPWPETVLYEVHVGGFSRRHPEIPARLRGTYGGLAAPAAIEHFRRLGVTSLELLPIQHRFTEPAVAARGLTNYWGYNPLGLFAPDARFATGGDSVNGSVDGSVNGSVDGSVDGEVDGGDGRQVTEFREMVATLHEHGIEVILDVVYNHTAEGRLDSTPPGPTLSWRGIDNRTYYRHDRHDPGRIIDFTGCGNTLDIRQPPVLRMVLDSLRHWVIEYDVDGFRFDLATALGRDGGQNEDEFRAHSAFLSAVYADPLLRTVKLIAEPWDLGPGGYQLGGFGQPWAEWNGRYRDAVRDFWRGTGNGVGELASRLAGSSDVYAGSGRGPSASINFVTAHDGFTLADLTSHESKHNESNGENNRDGTDDNRSANYGIEGPTTDPAIAATRRRQVRNFLATLLLSAGVPMLSHGDEIGRTQQGNNNAYCQDNELTWLDWNFGADSGEDSEPAALLRFTADLTALRRRTSTFPPRWYFTGPTDPDRVADIEWLRPDGSRMTPADWADADRKTLGVYLADQSAGAGYLFWLHAGSEDAAIRLPGPPFAVDRGTNSDSEPGAYRVVFDTSYDNPFDAKEIYHAGDEPVLVSRSSVLMRATAPGGPHSPER